MKINFNNPDSIKYYQGKTAPSTLDELLDGSFIFQDAVYIIGQMAEKIERKKIREICFQILKIEFESINITEAALKQRFSPAFKAVQCAELALSNKSIGDCANYCIRQFESSQKFNAIYSPKAIKAQYLNILINELKNQK